MVGNAAQHRVADIGAATVLDVAADRIAAARIADQRDPRRTGAALQFLDRLAQLAALVFGRGTACLFHLVVGARQRIGEIDGEHPVARHAVRFHSPKRRDPERRMVAIAMNEQNRRHLARGRRRRRGLRERRGAETPGQQRECSNSLQNRPPRRAHFGFTRHFSVPWLCSRRPHRGPATGQSEAFAGICEGLCGNRRPAIAGQPEPDMTEPPKRSDSITAPLRHSVFRRIWLASLLSNLGLLIQGVGAAWAMTQMTSSADKVALVQTALMLPIMLISMPAGAIADMHDRRVVALVSLLISLTGATALTVLAWLNLVTPNALLRSASSSAPAWRCSGRPGRLRSASRCRPRPCRLRSRSTASATTSRAASAPRSAASSLRRRARLRRSPSMRCCICRCWSCCFCGTGSTSRRGCRANGSIARWFPACATSPTRPSIRSC